VERLTIISGREVDASNVRHVLPKIHGRTDGTRLNPPADPGADVFDRSLSNLLDDFERSLISRALTRTSGNVAEASRLLQTDRANLYRRMKRLAIS
ncbi:MAG: helix-turn-helix domain-containing protein, partial [Gemmatimonadota bacterium]